MVVFAIQNLIISIHALVKRATMLKDSICVKVGISIHALVKRATEFLTKNGYLPDISIHALVKRATRLFRCSNSMSALFQSTPS
ncbi:hypothetical protein PZH37_19360, partial [[Eubacterium] siraeum]|nr:hypothetical protein [[Eubacterium] siraeum]